MLLLLERSDSLGLTYEKAILANGLTENKHYLSAAGQVFALYVSRTGTLGSQTASTTSYLHPDRLGSVAAISDQTGVVTERLAYDPWGKRRAVNGIADATDSLVGVNTHRGYTLHEHLDEVGVIHMNARIYDPLIGRFMSADDVIPDPTDMKAPLGASYTAKTDAFSAKFSALLSKNIQKFISENLTQSNPAASPVVTNSQPGDASIPISGASIPIGKKITEIVTEKCLETLTKFESLEGLKPLLNPSVNYAVAICSCATRDFARIRYYLRGLT